MEASTNIVAACRVHGFTLHADGTVSADPPRFLTPRVSNAGLTIGALTSVNKVTVLESSSDLVNWSPVATNSSGRTQFQWTNVNWKVVEKAGAFGT